MRDCPHCRHQLSETIRECPECGYELADSLEAGFAPASGASHQPHVPIARFANVAEAGYFHCELEGRLDCEVRLITQNHFDAPSASWWSNYVLTVPTIDSEEATGVLKQLVAETDQSEFADYSDEPVSTERQAGENDTAGESRIHWTPIILTLTAGTFVIWAAKQVHRHAQAPAGKEAKQVDIWDHLSRDGSPWIQHFDGGRGRRELLIDRAARVATLREDVDGDGVFDRNSRIMLTPAAR